MVNKRLLIQLDITQLNVQWVNIGAGIWCVSAINSYPWVDNILLTGFTAQDFLRVGSITASGITYTEVDALADLTNVERAFYYDAADRALYVCFEDFNPPEIFKVFIGVVYGYSFHDITPNGTTQFYEGRLAKAPKVTTSRDPLFWGKITFNNSQIELINTDGEFDEFAKDNNVYGNQVRIYHGDVNDNFDDYNQLYTGYIEQITIGEDKVNISLIDRRKQFSRAVTYSCTAKNALDAIVELLNDYYQIPYNDTFYDTSVWDAATLLVEDVTIDMQEPDSVINVIEWIASSIFGAFIVLGDGRFSFKLIDQDAAAVKDIEAVDILGRNTISYNPAEVISSVRVGYNKDWVDDEYTYYTDDDRESDIFIRYKTYNQKTFDTVLPDLSAATAFATEIYDYAENVQGEMNIRVPFDYYGLEIGDNVNVQIERINGDMLGFYKAEIMSLSYDLERNFIDYGLRLIRETFILATEEDIYITTDEGYFIAV